MALMEEVQRISSEYNAFKNAYFGAGDSLDQVIRLGATLYSDSAFSELFPNSIAAYQAYLLSLQQAINTFVASLPAEPQLNG